MSDPFWLAEATASCPAQAREVKRLTSKLQALPKDAPMGEFIEVYEAMLEARTVLYEAWIDRAFELEQPNHEAERHAR
jgi:hypothetical protein